LKKLVIALLVIVGIIGLALVYLGSNLDSIAAKAIENIGSKALGVDVSVGSVELELREGSGSIRDFEIANPPGYAREPLMSLGELTLQLDSESKGVKLLRAGAPEIRVESKGGTSNVDVLLEALGSEPAESGESEVVDEAGQPLEMRIDRIEIEAARAVLVSDERDEPIDLQVRALTFDNLRGTGEEIANQILTQLMSDVKAAAGQALRASVDQAVEDKKEEVRQDIQDAADQKKEELRENLKKKRRGDG
jgi:hypothetical protein